MHNFGLYFSLGRQHIANLNGLDHILFIAALCIRYHYADWKKVLLLITAFTVGHSITLALSVFNIVHLPSNWVEFLIPVTIFITAVSNLFIKKFVFKSKYPVIYFFSLFFGLVHGLGFSNYLRSLLGRSQSIVVELLAFNIGLEVGQLLIVIALLFITFVALSLVKVNRREYILLLSGGILGIALQMALHRLPF